MTLLIMALLVPSCVGSSLADPGVLRTRTPRCCWAAPPTLLGVALQVIYNLLRTELGEPLAHQCCHSSHVRRRLAGTAKPAAAVAKRRQRRLRAGRADDVGLDPAIGRRPPAAVTLDGANVVPRSGAHGQHPWVCALTRTVNAALLGGVVDFPPVDEHQLHPLRCSPAAFYHPDSVFAATARQPSQPFVWNITFVSHLWMLALPYN